jgi:hypothetical protein
MSSAEEQEVYHVQKKPKPKGKHSDNQVDGILITLTITESRRLIYNFKNGMFATSVHCFVRRFIVGE